MILYPPERWDANEWFILLSALSVLGVSFALPRRLSGAAVVVFAVYSVFLAQTVDSIIAVKPYDLYDVGDSSKYEYGDVFMYYFSYPPSTYLFVYAYDRWKPKGRALAAFILGAALITTGLEGLANAFDVFTYKAWRLIYSSLAYVPLYASFVAMYHLMRRLFARQGIRFERAEPRGLGRREA